MSGLQTAFYIIGIVYMGISLLLIFGLVAAVLVIRSKVISLENMVKDKLNFVGTLTGKAADVVDMAKKFGKRGKH